MANGESTVTVKWWGILLVFIGIYGWFFVTALAHESRLTKVETTLDVNIASMTKSLDRLSCTVDKIAMDKNQINETKNGK